MLQKYWLNVLAVALNVNRILLCTALKLNSCDVRFICFEAQISVEKIPSFKVFLLRK